MTIGSQHPSWPPKESTNFKRNKETKFDDQCKYIISKKPLGEGSYSTVFECKNTQTNKHYACKRYTKNLMFGMESMLQNEFEILKSFSESHEHLVKLKDYFETEKYLFLVTDLAKGGELFDTVLTRKKIPESDCVQITAQLVDTLSYLHNNKIVHRDIKAENILFQSKNKPLILVADFGLAKILEKGEKLYNKCGTLSYMAPEMFHKKGYDFTVDIWALGVVVYFMLCGYMPFDCETDEETAEAISKSDYMFEPPEYWSHISPSAKDFISKCFINNPDQRFNINEAALHPFLSAPDSTTNSSIYSKITSQSSLSTLNTTSSSVSLVNKLQESLSALRYDQLHERSLLSVHLTPSDSVSTKLQGAMCESPHKTSEFNTPITSANISRVQSTESMNLLELKFYM